jgi:cyanate lyase
VTREECTQAVLESLEANKLTLQQVADAVGRHVVWTTSALLGQSTMSADEAAKAIEVLGLGKEAGEALQRIPSKGTLTDIVPSDPLMYRFYEILQVYGTTLKAVIHEKFGDGIMSAIDFTMDVEKVPDPRGDRVRVTMEGKYLAYKKW